MFRCTCLERSRRVHSKAIKIRSKIREVISIGIGDFNNFIKARKIGKCSEAKSFSTIEVQVDVIAEKLYKDSYSYKINVFKNIIVHVSKSYNLTVSIKSL